MKFKVFYVVLSVLKMHPSRLWHTKEGRWGHGTHLPHGRNILSFTLLDLLVHSCNKKQIDFQSLSLFLNFIQAMYSSRLNPGYLTSKVANSAPHISLLPGVYSQISLFLTHSQILIQFCHLKASLGGSFNSFS